MAVFESVRIELEISTPLISNTITITIARIVSDAKAAAAEIKNAFKTLCSFDL